MGAWSSKLHVANGSDKTIEIHLSDKVLVTESSVDVKGQIGTSNVGGTADVGIHPNLEWDLNESKSMLKLAPGEYILAHQESRKFTDLFQLTGEVYCTIHTLTKEYICKHFKVPFNRSIIVTKELTILIAKKGKIWIDESGQNHNPATEPEKTRF